MSETCTFHPVIKKRENSIISNTFTTITNLPNINITADVNAHSLLWYSPTETIEEN